jgi:hypothetical protein
MTIRVLNQQAKFDGHYPRLNYGLLSHITLGTNK